MHPYIQSHTKDKYTQALVIFRLTVSLSWATSIKDGEEHLKLLFHFENKLTEMYPFYFLSMVSEFQLGVDECRAPELGFEELLKERCQLIQEKEEFQVKRI